MSSQYYLGLPIEEKSRYLAKLKCDNVTLPDPFNKNLRQTFFSTDLSDLPEVSQVNIFEYLVEKECVYTREAFKAYRSLDAYNYFHSGKVKMILTHGWKYLCHLRGNRGGSDAFKELLRLDHCEEVRRNPEWILHLHGRQWRGV
ncbi:hypothetical protein PO909_029839 [Leuciscus waleckii]